MYLFICALRGSICINLSVSLLPLDVHFEKIMVVPLASEEKASIKFYVTSTYAVNIIIHGLCTYYILVCLYFDMKWLDEG